MGHSAYSKHCDAYRLFEEKKKKKEEKNRDKFDNITIDIA